MKKIIWALTALTVLGLTGCASLDHQGWARRVDYFHTLPNDYPGK